MDITSKNYPGWMSQNLPDFISRLNDDESKEHLDKFNSLTKEECHKRISLPWPTKLNLRTVAIQDGFDLSVQNSSNLELFLNTYSSLEVVFWATYDLKAGVYKGNYNDIVRGWISSEFILSPVSMVAINTEIVIIINEQLSFTLIGASDEKINYLESLYESTGGMENNFKKSLSNYFKDHKNCDYKWVCEAVLPFCKWF